MTKAEAEAKVKEILAKDAKYKDAKITVTFTDKKRKHKHEEIFKKVSR